MRLIDADALEKELKKDIMGGLNYRWYINNAPTVCDIEQIRDEIIEESLKKTTMERTVGMLEAVRIIDKYTK